MILRLIAILLVLLAWTWGAIVILIAGSESQTVRFGMVIGYLATVPIALYFFGLSWRSFVSLGIVFAALLFWWSTLTPTNDKDWLADVENIPYGVIKDDILTLNNVRNFDYKSRTEFTKKWETRDYDLSRIKSLDLYLSYWGSPHITHTIMSWGFANGDYLAVSIEARKDKSQKYSAIKGFFKQFNLVYVAADERDLVQLRTNFRKERVYLYRLSNISANRMRGLLESYVAHMNRLVKTPEFYNALTKNCTSAIRLHTETDPDRLPSDWRLVANGHIDELLYEQAAIRQDLPFEQLRAQSRIDLAMQKLGAKDYSSNLRKAAKLDERVIVNARTR